MVANKDTKRGLACFVWAGMEVPTRIVQAVHMASLTPADSGWTGVNSPPAAAWLWGYQSQ